MDIGQALLRCEAVISMTTNWRLHTVILGQLECLPLCMPSDFIYSHFVPVIFNRIYVAVSDKMAVCSLNCQHFDSHAIFHSSDVDSFYFCA